MIKSEWTRLYKYEQILLYLFTGSLVFLTINEEIKLIPFEISGYFFWLSLGFRLAKWEIIRVQKKQTEISEKNEGPFSKN